jgi:hypothetical protein
MHSYYFTVILKEQNSEIVTEIWSIVVITCGGCLIASNFLNPLRMYRVPWFLNGQWVNISIYLAIIYLPLIAIGNVLSSLLLVSFWAS